MCCNVPGADQVHDSSARGHLRPGAGTRLHAGHPAAHRRPAVHQLHTGVQREHAQAGKDTQARQYTQCIILFIV